MIDAHEIASRLWQGADPPRGRELRSCGVQVLVLCAMEHQRGARDYPGVAVVHAPMLDIFHVPAGTATRAAAAAAEHYRRGATVFTACHQGRNRSGLISALILRELGFGDGRECADRVRSRRPGALTNTVFYRWLCGLPAKH